MARKPNYAFERNRRAREKAAKKKAKLEAKAAVKAAKANAGQAPESGDEPAEPAEAVMPQTDFETIPAPATDEPTSAAGNEGS